MRFERLKRIQTQTAMKIMMKMKTKTKMNWSAREVQGAQQAKRAQTAHAEDTILVVVGILIIGLASAALSATTQERPTACAAARRAEPAADARGSQCGEHGKLALHEWHRRSG